jgi:hypothetical protein
MRKIFLIVGGLVAVSVVLTIFASLLIGSSITISQEAAVPKSYAAATAYDTDVALVAGDTSFISYHYTTGAQESVSASAGAGSILSTSDTVSTTNDKKYILFHNTVNTEG